MEAVALSVKEVAELKGCSERYIQLLIESDKLQAESIKPDIQSPGRGGVQYRIPLTCLDDKLQLKYKRLERKRLKEAAAEPPHQEAAAYTEEEFSKENLTGAERAEIVRWKEILEEWQLFRHRTPLNMEAADENFIENINIKYPEMNINRRTLYRKKKLLNESGELALLDKRGKHRSHNKKLKPEIWDIFEYFYLDMSRKSARLCAELTESEFKKRKIEIKDFPTVATFARAAKEIPEPYVLYFRYGEKIYKDKADPYIRRIYENLEPNDIWVADNHTFDIMVRDGEKVLRLYLTGYMDVRSRKMMGWYVTDRPCSDATIFALRSGIEKYGIPKQIYTDNGREFLTHDIGGNGFRKKSKDGEAEPPTILKQLGIEFKTALPRNARAKGIERAFSTIKDTFSKLFESYTGGNILEKPDKLKDVVKKPDRLKTVEEFKKFVDIYIQGYYNKRPHSGDGMYNKSPDEVFAKLLVEQRRATQEQLDLMFMRWSRPLKVLKNGVTLTFYGKKLQYFDEQLWANHFGKQVYVRFNPDDLSQVRIYDMDERFLCIAPLDTALGYDATKEEIAGKQQEKRAASKIVTAYKKQKDIKTHDALELMMEKAMANMEDAENIDPKIINMTFIENQYKLAAGGETDFDAEEPDWTAALRSLREQREEG